MENIQKTREKKSFWGKLMKKNKVNSYDIAEKTNIPEEKVKEIINGERTLPKNKVNDFVKAIHETKKESKNGLRNEALLFFTGKDIRTLRLKFNYETQRDLAEVLKVSQYTVSRAENNGPNSLHTTTLLKFYNFFKDELNIKVNKKKEKVIKEKDNNGNYTIEYYRNYFKGIDLKQEIANTGKSIPQFAKSIGLNPSTIYKYALGTIEWSINIYRKVFNALNNVEEDNKTLIVKIDNDNNYKRVSEELGVMSREVKNSDIYKSDIPNYTQLEEKTMTVIPDFDANILFEYLINNCITKNVVELHKLLNKYFRSE